MRLQLPISFVILLWLAGCAGTDHGPLQWVYTGGPLAQDVVVLLPDAGAPGEILAVLENGDLYRTRDEGGTWQKLSTVRPRTHVRRLVQDPENRELIYAATEDGLFISRNRGSSWEPAGPTPYGAIACRTLAIDPWKTSTLYLGTREHGILRSTDGGVHWTGPVTGGDVALATADVVDIAVDATRPDMVMAVLWRVGLIGSTDGGASWTRVSEETTSREGVVTHLLLHPRRGETILCATDAGTVVRTTDGGKSWRTTRRDEKAWRILTLVRDPQDSELLFAGTEGGVLRSSDFGTTWTRVVGGMPSLPTELALGIGKRGSLLFAYGPGIGVRCSRDGGETWTRADAELGGAAISFVASAPAGEEIFAATRTALLTYDIGTGRWEAAGNGPPGGVLTSLAFDPDSARIMTATSTGGMFRSSNSGHDWVRIPGDGRMMPRFLDTHPAIRTRMLASGLQGAFVSTNQGDSWVQAKPPGNSHSFRSLTFTPRNAGIIYAATTAQGVVRTDDGGLSWETARYGLTSDSILAVTLGDEHGKTCYAWSSAGESFRSTNRGLEWSRHASPWTGRVRLAIAFDRLEPSSAVALVNGEDLYLSLSGGETWTKVHRQLPPLEVSALHWNVRTGRLHAGTRERGVYVMNLRPFLATLLEE